MVSHPMEPAPSGAGAALLLLARSWSSRAALTHGGRATITSGGSESARSVTFPTPFSVLGWHEQGTVKWGWALGTPG